MSYCGRVVSNKTTELLEHTFTYWVFFIVFLRIDVEVCHPASCHGLVSILPCKKFLFLFIPMHTLYHLGPNQRAFCNDTFERYHAIQVRGTHSARIARVLSEGTDVSTVVDL